MHSYMLLIGGSNPAMANVLFFVLIFFLKIFSKIAFTIQGSYYCMTVNYYY